jgi:hypothetical protein
VHLKDYRVNPRKRFSKREVPSAKAICNPSPQQNTNNKVFHKQRKRDKEFNFCALTYMRLKIKLILIIDFINVIKIKNIR